MPWLSRKSTPVSSRTKRACQRRAAPSYPRGPGVGQQQGELGRFNEPDDLGLRCRGERLGDVLSIERSRAVVSRAAAQSRINVPTGVNLRGPSHRSPTLPDRSSDFSRWTRICREAAN